MSELIPLSDSLTPDTDTLYIIRCRRTWPVGESLKKLKARVAEQEQGRSAQFKSIMAEREQRPPEWSEVTAIGLTCISKLVRYLYHYEAESRRAVGGRMEVEIKEEKKNG